MSGHAEMAESPFNGAGDSDDPAIDSPARRTPGSPERSAAPLGVTPGANSDDSGNHAPEATPRPAARQPRATPSPDLDTPSPVPTVAPRRRAEPSPVPDEAPRAHPTAEPQRTAAPAATSVPNDHGTTGDGGLPKATPVPTAATSSEPGVLDHVPTLVPTTIPVVPTTVPIVPTAVPTPSSNSGPVMVSPRIPPRRKNRRAEIRDLVAVVAAAALDLVAVEGRVAHRPLYRYPQQCHCPRSRRYRCLRLAAC